MLNKYLLGSWKEERKEGEREGGRKKGGRKEEGRREEGGRKEGGRRKGGREGGGAAMPTVSLIAGGSVLPRLPAMLWAALGLSGPFWNCLGSRAASSKLSPCSGTSPGLAKAVIVPTKAQPVPLPFRLPCSSHRCACQAPSGTPHSVSVSRKAGLKLPPTPVITSGPLFTDGYPSKPGMNQTLKLGSPGAKRQCRSQLPHSMEPYPFGPKP